MTSLKVDFNLLLFIFHYALYFLSVKSDMNLNLTEDTRVTYNL